MCLWFVVLTFCTDFDFNFERCLFNEGWLLLLCLDVLWLCCLAIFVNFLWFRDDLFLRGTFCLLVECCFSAASTNKLFINICNENMFI